MQFVSARVACQYDLSMIVLASDWTAWRFPWLLYYCISVIITWDIHIILYEKTKGHEYGLSHRIGCKMPRRHQHSYPYRYGRTSLSSPIFYNVLRVFTNVVFWLDLKHTMGCQHPAPTTWPSGTSAETLLFDADAECPHTVCAVPRYTDRVFFLSPSHALDAWMLEQLNSW